MSRLIDADELANKVADLYTEGDEATESDKVVNDVIDLIDNAPTVCNDNYSMGYQDGVKKVLSERPQGEWIEHSTYKDVLICSNCHHGSNQVYDTFKFCPNCGAKMTKEAENEHL